MLGATSIVAQAIDESPIVATMTINGTLQEEAMVKLIFRQFNKVAGLELTGPDFGPDLQAAKLHAVGTFNSLFTSNTSRAFQWARADLFGLPPDYLLTLPSKMEAVTPGRFHCVSASATSRGVGTSTVRHRGNAPRRLVAGVGEGRDDRGPLHGARARHPLVTVLNERRPSTRSSTRFWRDRGLPTRSWWRTAARPT